ncbi:MAG: protein-L-isoaspartate O-methyltransferase [Candidatus Harrisonbacteria bacterium RIFCSPLOWO2_02_FULL_45_10c]|uniref:Protein-L-isoaspartate O-methyltransferase n=1 Tax=Candidatus Harrisonbacteria bacterium RIFCSPLOWO2_02_FULL_45_10c TaxID=1798410 RepID=A0A1G1ZU03_9BACT|nr:MAG: protein-L-isoaspartate O-methyltransferase [Candidatus Harrisonbacteria bacterium RIFCSPLOWO2_02_FULL_45_10c]
METNEQLIALLQKEGYLKTQSVIGAFQAIDRKDFVPADLPDKAYANEALPIGEKQTISQPLVVAFMLEILGVKAGEKILEVGTGSGWKTALLASLVGKDGEIISIERIELLSERAKANLSKYGVVESGVVELVVGDGSRGYPEQAPYDKIIAAAAADKFPEVWKEQLKIGGRIVTPVGNSIFVVDKITKDSFEQKEYFGFSFVPLVKG